MNTSEHKVTSAQLNVMVDILSLNPELVSGILTSTFRKDRIRRKWEAIATLLNSGLGPKMNALKWRKIWTNQKLLTRCKAARIRGSQSCETLTELEKRVLEIAGPARSPTNFDFEADEENGDGLFEIDEIPVLTVDDSDSGLNESTSTQDADTGVSNGEIVGCSSRTEEVQPSPRRTPIIPTRVPAKRRRNNNTREISKGVKSNIKESLTDIQKQMELQTAAAMEQTCIMTDISRSLQQMAESFKNL